MDPQALTIWRGTLLLIAAAECSMQTGAAYWQASFRPQTIPGFYGMIAQSLAATLVLGAAGLIALWRFLGSRASLAAGLIAMACMKIAGETFARVFAVHHQDFYQGGAMVAGVLLGEAYARVVGISPDRGLAEKLEAQRFGMTGALGMLAGSYMAAGASKLLTGGFGWMTSSTIRLMILSHGEVEGTPWSQAIPQWTAAHPHTCMALEVGTLIIQLGAFMLIVGPRLRRLWASLIVAFHAGIYLTSHILFVSPMIFAAVVALPWARLLPRRSADAEDLGEVRQDADRRATRPVALALLALGEMVVLRLAAGW